MGRLFNAHVRLVYKDERVEASVSSSVADRTEFWWNERKPDEPVLFDSKIRLGEDLFNEIIPVPGAARHEHPQGHEALFSGPGLVPAPAPVRIPIAISASAHFHRSKVSFPK